MTIKISLTIEDDDGGTYTVREVLELFKAIEGINADEKKVEKKETASLFPCYAVQPMPTKGGGEWNLDQPTYAKWQSDFVGVNVAGELAKARTWLLANPSRLKTPKGMPSFCRNWLRRAFDATVEMVKQERDHMPEPHKPKMIDAGVARFRLIKSGVHDARDWSDSKCVRVAGESNLCS